MRFKLNGVEYNLKPGEAITEDLYDILYTVHTFLSLLPIELHKGEGITLLCDKYPPICEKVKEFETEEFRIETNHYRVKFTAKANKITFSVSVIGPKLDEETEDEYFIYIRDTLRAKYVFVKPDALPYAKPFLLRLKREFYLLKP